MRKLILFMMSGALIAGCGGSEEPPPQPSTPDAGVETAPKICSVDSDSESTPAYPFNYKTFTDEILPVLIDKCGTSGCHLAPDGKDDYNVWPLDNDECPEIQSFNAFYALSDFRIEPRASAIITAIDKTNPEHPVKYDEDNETLNLLLDYIADAKATLDAERPGSGPDLKGYFDQETYETQIDPVIHALNCTSSGCHNGSDDSNLGGGFGLTPNPVAGSTEMEDNFEAVTDLIQIGQITDVGKAKFYEYATNSHKGTIFGLQETNILRDWIQDALDQVTGEDPVGIGCEDVSNFNVGVFESEIMPMLRGDRDYNDLDGGRNSTGCARSECHGNPRGGNVFYIDESASPEERLENFSCYVDLSNPSNSDVLLCPLNLPGCIKSRSHPGEDVFANVEDRNYQRLLAYIYATKNGAGPLDFAFFVRKINVIFNDEDAVQDGAQNRTCADVDACHGIEVAGDPAPNGSNFAIITEASNETELFENFVQAANFTFFPDAGQSSLFLYPTNEIANTDNDFALGINHTGGKDFEVTDQEALDILKWAGGLFPNQDGFVQDVLVAGIFNGADEINDDPISNPEDLLPRIFLRSGQPSQFNDGEWDGFFSDEEFIDFNQAFNNGVNGAGGSVAYAAFYITNADNRDTIAQITVESPNDVELYIGEGNPGDVGLNGVVSRSFTLPAYVNSKAPIRVLVKVFQDVGDEDFGLTINIIDENGNPFSNLNREVVVTLSNINAGI